MMGNKVKNIRSEIVKAPNDKLQSWVAEFGRDEIIQQINLLCIGNVSAPNIHENFKITDCTFLWHSFS